MAPEDSSKQAKAWSSDLLSFLDEVEPLGTYAASGKLESIPALYPKVLVEGFGLLGFPFMATSAEALKAVAAKAPFGQGSETRYDESVRKAWQVDANKVTLGGGEVWDDYLNGLVKQACMELGFSSERVEALQVRANLYKLLYYEAGGHFTVHRDTEKEEGMFATLVVQLPSTFTGAALTVSHEGETATFELSEECESQFKYIAFYADCEHQLHPVTSGHRLCLAFNLVSTPTKECPTHAVNVGTEAKLQSIVSDWIADSDAFKVLGYRMGHQYTPQSFGPGNFKGRDAIVLQTLSNAKSVTGDRLFDVHVLLMERCVEIFGGDMEESVKPALVLNCRGEKMKKPRKWAVYKHNSSGWMIGRSDYEAFHGSPDDSDYDEYSDNERKSKMFGAKPDKMDYEGYRGNHSGAETQWYYAAAIVLQPNKKP